MRMRYGLVFGLYFGYLPSAHAAMLERTQALLDLLPIYADRTSTGYSLSLTDSSGHPGLVVLEEAGGNMTLRISFVENEVKLKGNKAYARQVTRTITGEGVSGSFNLQETRADIPGFKPEFTPITSATQNMFADLVDDIVDYLRNLKPGRKKS